MKRLLPLILSMPAIAFGDPFDILLQQRNIADTATLTRTAHLPALNVPMIIGIDRFTNLPSVFTISQPFDVQNGELVVSIRWDQVLNAPVLSPVATSGDYNDLINKPSITSQVNSDWSATSGYAEILNKPALASVATSGAYSDLSGAPSIPATQVQTDWNASTGLGALLNKPSTFPPSAHNQAWSTITSTPTTLAGYGIADGATLTQLGTKFTTPAGSTAQYLRGDGSLATFPALNSGTVTSVAAGTGLSGGTITTSGTISMPNTGNAGSYTNVTTDAQGRVTSGLNASVNDSPGRSLVTTTASTGFQVSATRNAQVCYEGSFSTTSTIGGPSAASVFLETADTNSTTPGDWTTKAVQTYSNNITLAVVLNQVQGNNWSICRVIPAGKFVRIRSGSITGTASVSINAQQQEVLQ